MTLLLGTIVRGGIVLSADGIEHTHTPDGGKSVTKMDRRKLWLSDRALAIAVSGANQVFSIGQADHQQELLIERIPRLVAETPSNTTIGDLVRFLDQRLTPDVQHTLLHWARVGRPLGLTVLWVAGFNSGKQTAHFCEIHWSPPTFLAEIKPVQFKLEQPRIVHVGEGTSLAIEATKRSGHSLNRLKNARLADAQEYLRKLYRKAESLQSDVTFGGHYHEITITPKRAEWTVPAVF